MNWLIPTVIAPPGNIGRIHRLPDDPVAEGERICSLCKEQKPVSAFQFISDTRHAGGGRFHSHCRACKAAARRKRRQEQRAQRQDKAANGAMP